MDQIFFNSFFWGGERQKNYFLRGNDFKKYANAKLVTQKVCVIYVEYLLIGPIL